MSRFSVAQNEFNDTETV